MRFTRRQVFTDHETPSRAERKWTRDYRLQISTTIGEDGTLSAEIVSAEWRNDDKPYERLPEAVAKKIELRTSGELFADLTFSKANRASTLFTKQ